MTTQIATRPACGHVEMHEDCVKCLAHHLDLVRHAEAMLKKHLRGRVGVVVHVTGGRKNGKSK